MLTPPPTDRDRERAMLVLDHIKRLRELGEFAGGETRQAEIHFIACMLRNERIELTSWRITPVQTTPIIRDLENGDVVVDYGTKWFRCCTNGDVITKMAKNGKVVVRPATPKERLLALGDAAFGPLPDRKLKD